MKKYLALSIKALLVILMFSSCTSATQIIAHRGASQYAPENTVASAKLAWEMNADAVEIDVHMSKDKKVMVNHDATTKRTAASGVDLVIKETMSDELRKLDVGSFKDPKYKGEKIPFLEEVIDTIPEGKQLFIEVKGGDIAIVPLIGKIIENHPKRSQFVIISFTFEVCKLSKELWPDIPVYFLDYKRKDKETGKYIDFPIDLITNAKSAKLDGLNLASSGCTKEYTAEIRKAGLGFYTWTINDLDEAQRLIDLGVDGITTNVPDVMLKLVAKQK